MTNAKTQRKDVLSDREIEAMIAEAEKIKSHYFRLRAKALVSLFITGKRREEVATLETADLEVKEGFLYITFMVVKKRKKKVLATRRIKRFPVESKYAQYIMDYQSWMKKNHPECKYLFPSVTSVFGLGLAFHKDKHLSGRQILRVIKQLNPKAWCHLFRETRGAEVVRADERKRGEASLLTIYRVQRALDLERATTAMNYINRYATETIEREEEIT